MSNTQEMSEEFDSSVAEGTDVNSNIISINKFQIIIK